jgi:hypothetical protein
MVLPAINFDFSSGEGRKTMVQWLRLALSKGPNRIDVSLLSPEDRNRSSIRNIVCFSYLEFLTMDKVQKLSDSEHEKLVWLFIASLSWKKKPWEYKSVLIADVFVIHTSVSLALLLLESVWHVQISGQCHAYVYCHHKKKLNSMVWVHERTIPTERPPLVGEVIANFCG